MSELKNINVEKQIPHAADVRNINIMLCINDIKQLALEYTKEIFVKKS